MGIASDSELLSDAVRLRSDFEVLRQVSAALHDTCARAHQSAERAVQDARRVRGELVRVKLPRELTCAAIARRLAEAHLSSADADELADVKTVLSELVSNAFVHGEGAIELRLARRRGRVLIDVRDDGAGASVSARAGAIPHGLDIVEALSLAWGTRAGSTRVWAELRDSRSSRP